MVQLAQLVKKMIGESCWHVSGGAGSTWPSFELIMGRKLRRRIPLRNQSQPKTFREHGGSIELLVWCTWRLELSDGTLSSSDGGPTSQQALTTLVGKTISDVEYSPPLHDLVISFSDGSVLRVFCDHVHPDECSIAQNWELSTPSTDIYVGPGRIVEVDDSSESG